SSPTSTSVGPTNVRICPHVLDRRLHAAAKRDRHIDHLDFAESEMRNRQVARGVPGRHADLSVPEEISVRGRDLYHRADSAERIRHGYLQPVPAGSDVPEQPARKRRLPLEAEYVEPTI